MNKFALCGLLLLSFACREKYNPVFEQEDISVLVAEGYITPGGETNIRLSRTSLLAKRTILPEEDAVVQVQGEDNSVYPLIEQDSGKYVLNNFPVNATTRYRIWIQTANNKQYASAFSPIITTPPLDSITWKRQNGGVEIFINSHGDNNGSRYYKWDYQETWEFKSDYQTSWEWDIKILDDGSWIIGIKKQDTINLIPDINENMYTCWKNVNSTAINIGSTAKLSENTVYSQILFHPENSWQLSYLYSVKVIQHAISKEAYQFYSIMKKNTEQLGSVFDAQPSELKGNITCLSNPDELVIGFIEVSAATEKRIYINNNQLPGWKYESDCEGIDYTITKDNFVSYQYYYDIGYFLAQPHSIPDSAPPTFAKSEDCVDCRLRGSSDRPAFWPQ